jgi:XTP/dITP diphosphohydrolase
MNKPINILIAGRNVGKINEIRDIARAASSNRLCFNVLSLDDITDNTSLDLDLEAVETGTTFEENAVNKAKAVANAIALRATEGGCPYGYPHIILADDSGLEIDALNGGPGVDSANFMGRETPYSIRHKKILELMANIPEPKRTARFVCVIAMVAPWDNNTAAGARIADPPILTFKAAIEGQIALSPLGDGGFGYDPIFYLPELKTTTACLNSQQKNAISHRGKALRMAFEHLDDSVKT